VIVFQRILRLPDVEEHMKSILTSLAASALLAAFAAAQPRYTVTDLGPVGPAPGQPYFITNDGLVSGAVDTPNGTVHAMLWFKRLKLDIGTPGLGGPNNAAFGVNERVR
jgi:hypothetical protein